MSDCSGVNSKQGHLHHDLLMTAVPVRPNELSHEGNETDTII